MAEENVSRTKEGGEGQQQRGGTYDKSKGNEPTPSPSGAGGNRPDKETPKSPTANEA
ncbi:MAG TPA: hypothetical protein VGX92_17625 [Pyrinomonadaceae bacterium]|jgi:hypothetical protein|nr:hypothetical protein [Pyrinomonadaceae bacterium]